MSFKETLTPRPFWFWGFLILLFLLPLPFGGNRPWASDLFAVLSGLLLLAMLWQRREAPAWTGNPPRARLLASAIGLSLVVLWALAQTASWTPALWHHPIWEEVATILGPLKSSISIAPDLLPEALARLLGYVAFFILALHAGREKEQARLILRTIAGAGICYALYGLLVHATGSDTILWFKKWAYQGFLTSTFVNKNSYAAYAGLGLLCAIAVTRESLKTIKVKDHILAQKSRAAAIFTSLRLRDYALFLPVPLLLGALALTGSRAGVASTFLGAFSLLFALAINHRWTPKRWALLAGGLAIVFLLFVGLGGDTLLTRIEDQRVGEDSSTRLAAYELEQQAISDNPWLGFGLGSFDNAFRLYRDATLPIWFHHAHNDYLEMMMDLGVPMALLLFFSIAFPVSCCISGIWKRRRDAIYPAIAVAATLLLGTHSLVDFSFHIPAIAATYAALLGLGVAQSFSSQQKEAPTAAKKPTRSAKKR